MNFAIRIATVVALFIAHHAVAQGENPQQPTASPATGLQLNKFNNLGCYSDPGNMWDMGPYIYQTTGWCQPLCVRQGVNYFALVNGTNCFCGSSLPDGGKKVSDDECNQPCNGFNQQTCGGNNMWQVYQDGFRNGDPTGTIMITTPVQTWFGHEATFSASSSDKNSGPSTVVSIVTLSNGAAEATEVPASQSATESAGPNKAAIAAGIVVGLVALTAIAGGIFFYMRRQKNRALEEERRRHESVTNFVTRGEKPPSTFSNADSRLEPSVMFQRRQSDGSIMDNQDYSRRILKITNPDNR